MTTLEWEMLNAVPADLRDRIEVALRDFVAVAVRGLDEVGPDLAPIASTMSDFVLDAGKRLRPAFCYWAGRAAGAPDSDALIGAAASLELLQASALVHDDVIDHSDTRRGQPAVHRRFEQLHRDSGWAGDPGDFGAAAAILAGDLLLTWSLSMLTGSGLDDAALRRTRAVTDDMHTELMAGQYLDILEQAHGGGSVESALRVARYKAAKYTVERPMHLGAAIADAAPDVVAAYSSFGLPLGEAFQLRDDLLGVYGDPAVTGKPAGDDLREGKRTVLVALALERAGETDRATINAGLGEPGLDESTVEQLRSIVTECGARAEVEQLITARTAQALAALDAVDLEPAGRDALVALAEAATRRSG
jgi:geranylgeranyl diphosphate synthase type I